MLTKVEIENFQSINSKQVLKFNKDITTIVGKNEAGKSSILNAVEKLNGETIELKEKNVKRKNDESTIKGFFKIDLNEIKKINSIYLNDEKNKLGIYMLPETYGDLYFSITTKSNDEAAFYTLFYMKESLLIEIDDEKYYFSRVLEYLEKIKKELIKTFSIEEMNFFTNLDQCMSEEELITEYEKLNLEDNIKEKFNIFMDEIKNNSWVDLLPEYEFIKFSSFTDVLNDEILISEIDKNLQAKNLLKIAKIDINELKKYVENNKQDDIYTTEKYFEFRISDKFKEIYKQADSNFIIRIRVDTKDNKIFFFTNDKTSEFETIPLSKRSDGFRWYFSMYLTLYEYLEEKKNNYKYILLLDEPNMFLHASAQKDLLERIFKKEFGNFQILYSTHSPYMIDTDNPYSIRIIEKKDETKIYTSAQEYVKDCDKVEVDTITPLMVALDLHLSNNLTFCVTDNLLLVEGSQDLYILKAFIKRFGLEEEFKNIKIIACMGANTEVSYMFSYLYGMGYKTFLLLDNDKPGKKTFNKLSEDLCGEELLILYTKKNNINKECKLEDLFSGKDFETYLYKKDTILYKRIYDNFDTMKFLKETENNFKNMLDLILKIINTSDDAGDEEKEKLLASEFITK